MKDMKLVNRIRPRFSGRMGLILAVFFLVAGPAVGDESLLASSGTFTNESKGKPDSQSTIPPGGDTKENENSPVIGGGIRTPPDIGASGTASPTPPVRTESPTGEPQLLPDVSPVPAHPSDTTENSSAVESQPLGQPDPLKKRKKIKESLQ
jgi:hypothetical protein